MEAGDDIRATPVGRVMSTRKETRDMPHQGRGSGIRAVIEIFPEYEPAARDVRPGDVIWVLTWFHLADRTKLRGRPQGNPAREERGVFSLRSPGRPNPIGLTLVEVIAVDGVCIEVEGLEAVDGTPVVDLKPYVERIDE